MSKCDWDELHWHYSKSSLYFSRHHRQGFDREIELLARANLRSNLAQRANPILRQALALRRRHEKEV